MFDPKDFRAALDPIVRIDGSLLYAEALCRPIGCTDLGLWFNEHHQAGRSSQIDLLMASMVSKLVCSLGVKCGINITPSTAIFHGEALLDNLGDQKTDVIIEIVEWDSPCNYFDSRFLRFCQKAKVLGFSIMLDDVGSGSFIDPVVVQSIEADGMKTHMNQLKFALGLLKPDQELIIEYVETKEMFNSLKHSGVTAYQGIYPRSINQQLGHHVQNDCTASIAL